MLIAHWFKGTCSEILGNEFALCLQIIVTFQTNTSSMVKNCKFLSPLKVIIEHNVYVICCFIQWGKPRFLISERIFTDFSQTTQSLCMKLDTYNLLNIWLNSWYQNLYVFKKNWVRGWGCGLEQAPLIHSSLGQMTCMAHNTFNLYTN